MRIGAHPRARWLPAALFLLLFYASSGRRSRHYTPACVHPLVPRATRFDDGSLPTRRVTRRSVPFPFFKSPVPLPPASAPLDLVTLSSLSLLKLTLQNILFVPHGGNTVTRVHPLATSPRSIVYICTRRRGCSHRHVPRLRADTRTTETSR